MAVPASNESGVVDTQMENGDNSAVFCDGQLCFLGHEVKELPSQLSADFADRTTRLDLSFNCLQSLQGLEKFTRLTELIMDNNELSDDIIFPRMASLTTLSLNKNKFVEVDVLLSQLKEKCPHLHYLSLLGNPACPNQLSSTDNDDEDYQRYRYYVLFHLPHLKFLDSSAVKPAELQEARRRGQFLQVVRPPPAAAASPQQAQSRDSQPGGYSPLPASGGQQQTAGQHLGFYSKARSTYLGQESEGNRFIRSKDL